MKWNVQLPSNDFSTYEFVSDDGKKLVCKYNRSQDTLRLKWNDHHAVFLINPNDILHRRFALRNVYGSDIAIVTRNLWHENTGNVIFNDPAHKIHYNIDAYSSFIEITEGIHQHICSIAKLPHPGRSEHYVPVLISLAWMQMVGLEVKVEVAA